MYNVGLDETNIYVCFEKERKKKKGFWAPSKSKISSVSAASATFQT